MHAVNIGTSLSVFATRVMLLGSGELGKEVIIALQRLGVEVIAVDRYPNAPGQQVAHRAHIINMADGAALCMLVWQKQPHLIVPEIEAIATDMLKEIEAAGLARAILCLPVDVSQREPGASAVIYGRMDEKRIAFRGVDEALRVPGADIRLFGKPEAFKKRRMGVALANATAIPTKRECAPSWRRAR